MLCWHGINEYDSVIAKIICRQLQDHKRKKEIAKIWLICGLKRSPVMSKNKTKKNNDPTWDKRTRDKRTIQYTCIARADPGVFLGQGAPIRNDVTNRWGKQI